MLREGAGVGIHLVVAGDRSLRAPAGSGTLTEDKLVLRLADRTDYSLAGHQPQQLPDDMPPGRAFRAESGIETQVALLDADPSGQAQAAALGRHRRRRAGPRRGGAAGPPAVPGRRAAGAGCPSSRRGSCAPTTPTPLWALVGVGGDELAAMGPDLESGARLRRRRAAASPAAAPCC